jgi:hypothetical protein
MDNEEEMMVLYKNIQTKRIMYIRNLKIMHNSFKFWLEFKRLLNKDVLGHIQEYCYFPDTSDETYIKKYYNS